MKLPVWVILYACLKILFLPNSELFGCNPNNSSELCLFALVYFTLFICATYLEYSSHLYLVYDGVTICRMVFSLFLWISVFCGTLINKYYDNLRGVFHINYQELLSEQYIKMNSYINILNNLFKIYMYFENKICKIGSRFWLPKLKPSLVQHEKTSVNIHWYIN